MIHFTLAHCLISSKVEKKLFNGLIVPSNNLNKLMHVENPPSENYQKTPQANRFILTFQNH